jgi:hypothetical protein
MRNDKALLVGIIVAALLCLGGASLVAQPFFRAQTVPPAAEVQAPAPPAGPRLDYYGDPLPAGALARIGPCASDPTRWEVKMT